MLAFACVALVTSALLTSNAEAAGADGVYKLTKISSEFTANGETVNIPNVLLENILLTNGKVTIKNNQFPVNAARWASVLERFNSFGFDGKITISGPKNFALKKSGKTYAGKTDKPISLSLVGTFQGRRISLVMKINYAAKISNNVLTVTAPVTLTAAGLINVEGTVVMKAKK